MKVLFLRSTMADGKGYQAGETEDISDATAKMLISIKKASPIDAKIVSDPVMKTQQAEEVDNRMIEQPKPRRKRRK